MDFKQLEAYVHVVELNSFSKAAEAIYVSQPSVSAYIHSLEKDLQVQLIFRSTKEVLPTNAGKIFYEYAKNILTLRDKAVFSIQSLSENTSGQIEILASSVPSQYILPELLASFHEVYPNISFHTIQSDSVDVVKRIAAQNCELGFVGAKIENSKCSYEQITSERLIIIAPNTDKFREMNQHTYLDFFYREYFIMREQGSGTRLRYEKFMKDMGLKPDHLHISASFSNTQSIIHAVSKGLGLSIVSEIAAEQYINQKWIIPIEIDFPSPQRAFYLVYKKDFIISPIAEIFIAFVRSYFIEKNKTVTSH